MPKIDVLRLRTRLENIVKKEIDLIIKPIMARFDEKIVPFEDLQDPARPSRFRAEFKQFLKDDIRGKIKTKILSRNKIEIEIGIGDEDKLGLGDKLDENTTDGLKIIGTILTGIAGNHILVTSEMTGSAEGRFGRAFIMPEGQYRVEAERKGWDVNKPIWSFSNFPGIPDFFQDLDLTELVKKIVRSFGATK